MMAYKTGGVSVNWHDDKGALMFSVIASGVGPDGLQSVLAALADALPQLVSHEEQAAEDWDDAVIDQPSERELINQGELEEG